MGTGEGRGDGSPPVPVLCLLTRLNVGGPARHALLLASALEPEFATTVAAGRPPPGEGEMTDERVRVRHVPLVRPPRPATDARALRAAHRLLVETGARVLHTHMAKAGAVGRLAAAARPAAERPRTVHTFHGHVLEGYFRPSVARLFVETERRLARRTDVLVAVSAEVRDELLDLGVGRPGQYEVIHLGLDLAPFLAVTGRRGGLRDGLGVPAGAPLIGAVGRLAPVKDLGVLVDAAALLPGAHLVFVGDGPSRAELVARAAAAGLGGRVHFTGWVTDVASAMADLDVVVLTSRNEGTPTSLIEAGASGRPVVATGVGGVALVVDDGVTGFLAPPGDPQAIARLVGRLLADRDLGRALGAAGRARVQARFGQERLLADVRALYSGLLGRGPVGRSRPGAGSRTRP